MRIVVEILLLVMMVVIIGIILWGLSQGEPTRQDILDELDRIRKLMLVLHCAELEGAVEIAECVDLAANR